MVEDNEADVLLIEMAIAATKLPISVTVLRDGDQAAGFFDDADADAAKPCPDLVLLDINLPKRTGDDVLKYMRSTRRCAKAHVIVVSTSDSARDREQMEQLGADGYFRKPSDLDEFMKLGELIKTVLAGDSD